MKKIIKKTDNYRTLKVLGVRVDFIDLEKTLSRLEKTVNSNKQDQITTPNSEHIIIAQDDYRFKNIINNSVLAVPDGIGVVWAAKMLINNKRIKKDQKLFRLSGIDLMSAFCALAAQKKWPIFLLGGKNNAAQQAAENLKNKFPKLKVGWCAGAKNINKETKAENKKIIKQINNFGAKLLFVAYGAPMQEKWINANLKKLKVKVGMGVGGAFDYLAGKVKRAPKWVRKVGLEWFWRLIQEPWRWKRQLRLIKFVFLVAKEKKAYFWS